MSSLGRAPIPRHFRPLSPVVLGRHSCESAIPPTVLPLFCAASHAAHPPPARHETTTKVLTLEQEAALHTYCFPYVASVSWFCGFFFGACIIAAKTKL